MDGQTSEAVLEVVGVTKAFHPGLWPFRTSVRVLDGATLEVRPGEIVGLVGENGSGKTTLMKVIVGMTNPDAGSVRYNGKLGYCPQLPQLWEKLTVAEHLRLYADAYGLSDDEAAGRSAALLDELGFARYVGYLVENLSGGTRQKLNLALSLLHDPDLLLLDEPYAGFDWETYVTFWEMSEHRRDVGMAILIVSHLIGERSRLTRTYTLKDGRCIPG
jgi:ABC-type multidrug transport system ATPase subunit